MSKKEGSLEPPRRHPVRWEEPQYYDADELDRELERVFDICHGCRRCVNLCNAFPSLFDLIDESETMEVDGVRKQDYWRVVDQCYLCDVCFMTKCPYVPPHEWNVDFPHLMLRAKAVKFRKGEVRLRDKILTSTDALGKLVAIPVVAQTVNAANRNGAARAVLQSVLGVDKRRELPPYAARKFRRSAAPDASWPVRDGERTPGKVAIFSTCYVNYNEPGLGHDLLAVLHHNRIPSVLVEREACCGMPKLELGDLDGVRRLKDANIPALAALARSGHAILAPIPSCALMFKQELPLLFPEDGEVAAVADAMFDPFEYLMLRHRDGLLVTDFKTPLGKVAYHIPCHGRVQNVGQKTREVLELIPGTEVATIERCAGHDGTWGVKEEFFELSMKIGRPVFRHMVQAEPDFISSDCPIAGRHIAQGMREDGAGGAAERLHPLSLLRKAYGI
ncbi:MAG: Fe-S oxidoreductase [Rhodocyclaceae bacterium]|nr:Fe-S oxidoreductase [Rhodocyclaceae bacterium]